MFAKYFAVLLAVALVVLPASGCNATQKAELKAIETVIVSDLHAAALSFLGALQAAKADPTLIPTAVAIGNAITTKLGVATPAWVTKGVGYLNAGNIDLAIQVATPAVAALGTLAQPANTAPVASGG